jgi:hypothetical protein
MVPATAPAPIRSAVVCRGRVTAVVVSVFRDTGAVSENHAVELRAQTRPVLNLPPFHQDHEYRRAA